MAGGETDKTAGGLRPDRRVGPSKGWDGVLHEKGGAGAIHTNIPQEESLVHFAVAAAIFRKPPQHQDEGREGRLLRVRTEGAIV